MNHKKIMHKFKRQRPRIKLVDSDQPPTPTSIDSEIARNHGTSIAIKAVIDHDFRKNGGGEEFE